MLELGQQARHAVADLVELADVGERAAAGLGRLLHEVAVGRRANSDRKEARAEPFVDEAKERRLVADGPVGQEDHLPEVALRRRARERRH